MTNVTYSLSDAGATQLPREIDWPAGTYKPTAYFNFDDFTPPGPDHLSYNNPGPDSGFSATFASTFAGTNPNGTWNLYVQDFSSGDDGSISGGWSLEINTGAPAHTQHVLDFDGDGKTDYAVARDLDPQLVWFIGPNGSGSFYGVNWGITGDRYVPADYDGDGKTDIAVWRPDPTRANFFILQSRDNTFSSIQFGKDGDDPSVVGDYDGDGKADAAVYRNGANTGDHSYFFTLGTKNNPNGDITYTQWGLKGDFPAPGDYDGDGKYDYVIQRDDGTGHAVFWRLQSTAGIDSVTYGLSDDLVVPGDYDGDGRTDIAVVRYSTANYQLFVLPSSTGTPSASPAAIFGLTAIDYIVQGDYDGDGKTDFAIWRPSVTDGQSGFWVNGSQAGVFSVPFGKFDDYPVANFNVR